MRVKVPRGNCYTYPDLSAACETQFATDIIEVLSASTRYYDRGEKLRQYQTIPSFVEYLFVDQYTVSMEHWLKQPNGSWLVTEFVDRNSEVILESVSCGVRIADVYEGVELTA